MKTLSTFILCLVILSLFFTCDRNPFEDKDYPVLKTAVEKVSEEGARFSASFLSKGNEEITEVGFHFWMSGEEDVISISLDTILYEYEFFLRNDLLKDKNYLVKSFAKTNDYIVYGNTVTFESLGCIPEAPVIEKMTPEYPMAGQEVEIIGTNFGFSQENIGIYFNNTPCEILSVTFNSILFILPEPKLGENPLKLVIGQYDIIITTLFEAFPVITSISPNSGFDSTELIISGSHFGANPSVYIGGIKTGVRSFTDSTIKVFTPFTEQSGEVEVKVITKSMELISDENFNIISHEVSSIDKEAVSVGESFNIYGNNFIQFDRNSHVRLDNQEYFENIISVDDTHIEVNINAKHPGASTKIYVINGLKEVYAGEILLKSIWTQLADFPGSEMSFPTGIAYNNEGYFGLGNTGFPWTEEVTGEWWKYNPGNEEWTQLASLPANPAGNQYFSFVANEKIYLGMGLRWDTIHVSDMIWDTLAISKDLWEYSPVTDSWAKKAPVPATDLSGALTSAFSYNGKGYVLLLSERKIVSYDPVNNLWDSKDIMLEKTPGESVTPIKPYSLTIGNKVYFGWSEYNWDRPTSIKVYEYNPESNLAKLIYNESMPSIYSSSTAFVINDKFYLGGGPPLNNVKISFYYEFNTETNNFVQVESFFEGRYNQAVAVINNKAYLLGGNDVYINGNSDFWLFDPSSE